MKKEYDCIFHSLKEASEYFLAQGFQKINGKVIDGVNEIYLVKIGVDIWRSHARKYESDS